MSTGADDGADRPPAESTAVPPPPRAGRDQMAERVLELFATSVCPPGYRLVSELGQGAMGQVVLARHTRLNRLVALKTVRGDLAGPEVRQRFVAEAEAVARLQHANIVQIFEVGETAGRPFLALEYVDGGGLDARLAAGPLRPAEAATLLATLATAVQHAHDQGIIHRDLKPANVLLTRDGIPKVGDFGLSKLALVAAGGSEEESPAATRVGAVVGTPSYMAPEQATGRSDIVGPRTDVYALGAVLYECLAGRPPFRGATASETIEQVRGADPVPVRRLQPRVPRDLETIVTKCLDKEPARRYATAAELADELGRYSRGEPVRARPLGPAGRLAKWARRRPLVASLSLFSGLAGIGLVVGGIAYDLRLREALREADRNRARAEANHQHAVASIDRLLTRVGESRLANVPEMEQVRAELLRDALESYQGLLAATDDPDPALRHETAQANLRVARIQKYLGRLDEAIKHVDAAIDLLTALPDRREFRESLAAAFLQKATLCRNQPGGHGAAEQFAAARRVWTELAAGNTSRYETELASCDSEEGLWHKDGGRWELAEAALNRALAVRRRRAGDRPDSQLAETLHNLALLYAGSGRAALALQFGGEAARAYEFLARSGDDEDARYRWGTALNNLGVYQRRASGLGEAGRATHEMAVKVRAALADAHPRVPSLRAQLAESCLNLSGTLTTLNRLAEAVDPGRRAVAVMERLVADGGDVTYRDMLVAALTNLALACQGVQRDEEALAAYGRALEVVTAIIKEDPRHLSAQATLAGLCNNRGNFERDRGRPAAAMPWYARSIEAAEAAVAINPQFVDAKTHREFAHGSRAQAYELLGDDAAAVRDWNRLVDLANEPQRSTYRFMRTPALQRAGLVGQVASEVDHLAAGSTDAVALSFLAEVCAGGARHPALAWRCVQLTPRAWTASDWPSRAKLVGDVIQSEKWRPMRAWAFAGVWAASRQVRQY